MTTKEKIPFQIKADLAASFQRAAIEQIIQKTIKAAKKHQVKSIIVGGGVSANQLLRDRLKEETEKINPTLHLLIPSPALCGDNAAIVGAVAYYKLLSGQIDKWYNINVEPNLRIGTKK